MNNVELPNAPSFSLNYRFRYQWSLFKGTFFAQLDGAWYDDQYLEVTNGGGAYQQAYNVSNVRLSYLAPQGDWAINLWIKNVTDEVYKQYSLDLGMLGAVAYYAEPRTAGISIHYPF